jgi:hypothetical protein
MPAAEYLIARAQLWFAERRLTFLREEAEMHRTLAISLADQAHQLERQVVVVRLELQTES